MTFKISIPSLNIHDVTDKTDLLSIIVSKTSTLHKDILYPRRLTSNRRNTEIKIKPRSAREIACQDYARLFNFLVDEFRDFVNHCLLAQIDHRILSEFKLFQDSYDAFTSFTQYRQSQSALETINQHIVKSSPFYATSERMVENWRYFIGVMQNTPSGAKSDLYLVARNATHKLYGAIKVVYNTYIANRNPGRFTVDKLSKSLNLCNKLKEKAKTGYRRCNDPNSGFNVESFCSDGLKCINYASEAIKPVFESTTMLSADIMRVKMNCSIILKDLSGLLTAVMDFDRKFEGFMEVARNFDRAMFNLLGMFGIKIYPEKAHQMITQKKSSSRQDLNRPFSITSLTPKTGGLNKRSANSKKRNNVSNQKSKPPKEVEFLDIDSDKLNSINYSEVINSDSNNTRINMCHQEKTESMEKSVDDHFSDFKSEEQISEIKDMNNAHEFKSDEQISEIRNENYTSEINNEHQLSEIKNIEEVSDEKVEDFVSDVRIDEFSSCIHHHEPLIPTAESSETARDRLAELPPVNLDMNKEH